MNEMGSVWTMLIALTLSVVSLLIGESDDDLQQQQDLYCEMVAIHKNTGGQYGWPDYKRIAQEACK